MKKSLLLKAYLLVHDYWHTKYNPSKSAKITAAYIRACRELEVKNSALTWGVFYDLLNPLARLDVDFETVVKILEMIGISVEEDT